MRTGVVAAISVLSVAACLATIDESLIGKGEGASDVDAQVSGHPAFDASTDGGAPAPPGPPCGPQNVAWIADAAACEGGLATTLQDRETATVTDTEAVMMGRTEVQCIDGGLVLAKTLCARPDNFGADGNSSCKNGRCVRDNTCTSAAAMAAQLPVAMLADMFCQARGYGRATHSNSNPVNDGELICWGDGTHCFPADSSCSTRFDDVDCTF